MADKLCINCKFLKKYTSDSGTWINVCEGEDADPQEADGLYLVTAVDAEIFDASCCLNFRQQGT